MRIVLAIGLLVGCGALEAGEVKIWRQASDKDFEGGKLTRVIVASDGTVSLSRQIDGLADVGADLVWGMAADGARRHIYVATGSPGGVARIDEAGRATMLHQDDKEQVFAVAVDDEGTVYAGVAPSGKIYRFTPGKEREEFFATGETYIWSLALDPSGNVLAATGPNGKVFRIGKDGKGSVVVTVKQPHVLSLALAPSGVLYFGTSKDGLVYRWTAPNQTFVVLDADQADISALHLTGDGTLFVGTGAPARPKLPGGSMPNKGSDPSLGGDISAPARGLEMDAGENDETRAAQGHPVASSGPEAGSAGPSASVSAGSSTAPARGAAAPGENAVYRIDPDGAVTELWRQKQLVLCLAEQGGKLLVGTGQEGRLFEIDLETRTSGELARLEHGQINALARGAGGEVLLAASNPGKLYRIENCRASSGTLVSSVLDARMQTRWGNSDWKVAQPDGASIEVTCRSGNVAEPDDTWSGWSAQSSKLPLGRFFQYQARFSSPNGKVTPSLSEFVLYYATVNQPPTVESVEVPNLPAAPVTNPTEKWKLKWKASDPNGDTLQYLVEARKEDWPQWVKIGEDLTKLELEWDPGSMPGGNYLVRVTATDRASNRAEEALSATKVSESFLLDREAPAVKIVEAKPAGKRIEAQGSGKDAGTRLTAAAYSVDGKPWIPLLPDDGLFDSREETTSFETEELTPGSHVLMVRYVDSAGHTGVADAVVTIGP